MDTLLRIVRFTNKTFALWVLLFGLANIAAMVLGMMGKLPVFAG